MTLLLDPSLLAGSRARTWLQRARQRGALEQVCIPASIFRAAAGDLRPRRRFLDYHGGPHLDLLHDAQQATFCGEPLPPEAHGGRDVPALAPDIIDELDGRRHRKPFPVASLHRDSISERTSSIGPISGRQ